MDIAVIAKKEKKKQKTNQPKSTRDLLCDQNRQFIWANNKQGK